MKGLLLILALLSPFVLSELATECSESGEISQNPESCTSFILCDNGVPKIIDCPPGLEFNAEALVCDLPANANCHVSETSTQQPTTQPPTTQQPTTQQPTTQEPTTQPPSTQQPTTQQPTTTSPNSCPPTGTTIIPNPNSCSSFFVCINGAATNVECPDGLLFNPNTAECDQPENVQCWDETTLSPQTDEPTTPDSSTCPPTGTTIQPNPDSCSSFLVCVNGNSTLVECPSGLLFNPATSACDSASNVTCGTETTTVPSIPQCPEEGYAIYPDPDDCSSFYVCVNGLSAWMNCPQGLNFNTETNKCDAETSCDGATDIPETTTQGPFIPDCPDKGTVQLPNPYNCNNFFICIDSVYLELSCPSNYSFNFPTQSCIHSNESTCSSIEANLLSFECPGEGSYPDPEDCGSYYVCVGGTPIHMICPEGTYFDDVLQQCLNKGDVTCNEGTSTQHPTMPSTDLTTPTDAPPTSTTEEPFSTTSTAVPPTTENPDTQPSCPPTGTIKVPNPEDCGSFYICIEGEHALIKCPDGYYFDYQLQNCDLAENVQCGLDNEPLCPSDGIAIIPNPVDCSSYYICVNGISDLVYCPPGLEFNSQIGRCDTPENAQCLLGSTTSRPTNTPTDTTPQETTSTSHESTTPNTDFPTTDEPTSTSTGTPGTCVTGELLPNPDDCASFFLCDNGIPFKIDCPAGLLFNPIALYCDNPENVVCASKSQIQRFLKFMF